MGLATVPILRYQTSFESNLFHMLHMTFDPGFNVKWDVKLKCPYFTLIIDAIAFCSLYTKHRDTEIILE